MGGINVGRWFLGGLVAAVVIFVLEGIASVFYMEEMTASLEAVGITMEMTGLNWFLAVAVSLVSGLVLVFLYAAARPRFGPGPRTAMIMATVYWAGGYVLSLIGYQMLGIYPGSMLVTWGIMGLVEMNLAALVGGWIYREPERPGTS